MTPFTEDQIEHLLNMYNRVGQEHMSHLIMTILEKRLGVVHTVTIEVRKKIDAELRILCDKENISAVECGIFEILSKRFDESGERDKILESGN